MYESIVDPVTGAVAAGIRRVADGAIIPADPLNTDWQAYQAWRAAGNAPAEPDIATQRKPTSAANA